MKITIGTRGSALALKMCIRDRDEGYLNGKEEGYMEGEKIGKDKERMKLIKKLMMKNSCTIEDAMELLDIPPIERQQYRQRIVS